MLPSSPPLLSFGKLLAKKSTAKLPQGRHLGVSIFTTTTIPPPHTSDNLAMELASIAASH